MHRDALVGCSRTDGLSRILIFRTEGRTSGSYTGGALLCPFFYGRDTVYCFFHNSLGFV